MCVSVCTGVFQIQEKFIFGDRNQGCVDLYEWALGLEGNPQEFRGCLDPGLNTDNFYFVKTHSAVRV